jgi:MOSC domain-containing protein YiiM
MNQSTGKITSLQLCHGHRKPMVKVDEAEAITNLGLKTDLHAIPDSSRQVLLIEQEALDELHLSPGEVKENITTRHIELRNLKFKDRLHVGAEVILEITQSCSPCSRMEEIRTGLKSEIAGRRGMLARVIRGGKIRQGDSIRLVQP